MTNPKNEEETMESTHTNPIPISSTEKGGRGSNKWKQRGPNIPTPFLSITSTIMKQMEGKAIIPSRMQVEFKYEEDQTQNNDNFTSAREFKFGIQWTCQHFDYHATMRKTWL